MRGTVLALDIWLDPNHRVPDLAYLDVRDWEAFADWLAQEPGRALALRTGTWRVRLFKKALNRHFGSSRSRTKTLEQLGVELDTAQVNQSDEMFIAEVLRVYFANDPTARPQAEQLALARRQSGNSWITVISQNQGFWRIPMVNSYFVDFGSLYGYGDFPAQFDFFHDFGIHRALHQAVGNRIDATSYGDALLAAIMALRDHVRQVSGLQQQRSDRPLMEQAFKQDGTHLRMNPLTDPDPSSSQQNEQRGFRELYCGVITALRNPLVHEGSNSQFAQERYPDKRTMLKYLSFLSILFERADGPLP